MFTGSPEMLFRWRTLLAVFRHKTIMIMFPRVLATLVEVFTTFHPEGAQQKPIGGLGLYPVTSGKIKSRVVRTITPPANFKTVSNTFTWSSRHSTSLYRRWFSQFLYLFKIRISFFRSLAVSLIKSSHCHFPQKTIFAKTSPPKFLYSLQIPLLLPSSHPPLPSKRLSSTLNP